MNKPQNEKDMHLQLLKESLWDVRDQRNFFKIMNLVLCFLLLLAIGGLVTFGIYNQKVIKEITIKYNEQISQVYQ